MIGSFAMSLRYSFGLIEAADMLEGAITDALANGARTGDIAPAGMNSLSTTEMGDAILRELQKNAPADVLLQREFGPISPGAQAGRAAVPCRLCPHDRVSDAHRVSASRAASNPAISRAGGGGGESGIGVAGARASASRMQGTLSLRPGREE